MSRHECPENLLFSFSRNLSDYSRIKKIYHVKYSKAVWIYYSSFPLIVILGSAGVFSSSKYRMIINRYRVGEAMKRLLEHPERSILDIAYEAGFSGKSSFHRSFIDMTGKTPSRYRKEGKSSWGGGSFSDEKKARQV